MLSYTRHRTAYRQSGTQRDVSSLSSSEKRRLHLTTHWETVQNCPSRARCRRICRVIHPMRRRVVVRPPPYNNSPGRQRARKSSVWTALKTGRKESCPSKMENCALFTPGPSHRFRLRRSKMWWPPTTVREQFEELWAHLLSSRRTEQGAL